MNLNQKNEINFSKPAPLHDSGPLEQRWLIVAAVWILVGSISYARFLVAQAITGTNVQVWYWLPAWVACFAGWAVLTPLVGRFARAYPLRVAMDRNLLLHALAAVPVSWTAMKLGAVAVAAYVRLTHGPTLARPWWYTSGLEIALEVGVYLGAIAVLSVMAQRDAVRMREQELSRLAMEKLELEKSLRDAELHALRMKLNPHFLFNALQTISSLMRVDVVTAERMMAHLGDLLRVALRLDTTHEITLAEEMNIALAYSAIEQMRFAGRLKVEADVAENLMNALVPSLILQPVVENAIRHGLAECRGKATVKIHAAAAGGKLYLRVVDNGRGFQFDEEGAVRIGVGLGTVRSRLRKLYKEASEFTLRNCDGGGAEVEIQLPLHSVTA